MSRLRTILQLIALPGPMRNLRRSANVEGIASGWALLAEVWRAARQRGQDETRQQTNMAASSLVPLDSASLDLSKERAIFSSWRNCWLFIVLGITYLTALLVPSLVLGHLPSAALLTDSLLIGLLFTAGYLRQALGNWRLRVGPSGTLWQFMRAGRVAWPRKTTGSRVSSQHQ